MRAWKTSFALALFACSSPQRKEPPVHDHDHAHHGTMPHRFENAEAWAKKFDDPARDAWQEPDRVVASLALDPKLIVADVGAGTGYFAVRLAPLVAQVVATDVEDDMVRYLKERAAREGHANIRAVKTPYDDPALETNAFDRILVVDVWHHLKDRPAYAAKLAQALKPDGFVAIVDFKLDAKQGPPPQHRISPDALIAELEAGGLEAKVALVLSEQYVIHARRKQPAIAAPPPTATFENMIVAGALTPAAATAILEPLAPQLAACLASSGATTTELLVWLPDGVQPRLRNAWQGGTVMNPLPPCFHSSFPPVPSGLRNKQSTGVYVVVKATPPGTTAPPAPAPPVPLADFEATFCNVDRVTDVAQHPVEKRPEIMQTWIRDHIRHPAVYELAADIGEQSPQGINDFMKRSLKARGIKKCSMQRW
jgi:SAM-dependent methyltransferase